MPITSIALLNYLSYHKDNNVAKLIFEYLFGDYYGPAFGDSFKYYNFYSKYLSEKWRYFPLLFTMIKNTSMQIYEDAVSCDSMLLQYITHQIEEICFKAVEQDCWALDFVQNQTKKYV